MRYLLAIGALLVITVILSPAAQAQFSGTEPNPLAPVHINEIYASHASTDDQEFIELIGNPGYSLDFHLVLVVEGDSASAGTLDRAFVLTGHTIPSDRFFVLGNTAVANLDLDIGSDNVIENGTDTFYLVNAVNQAGVDAITALLGGDVDPEDDGTSVIPTLSIVLDAVAMVDGGFPDTDTIYDDVPTVGPDGSFLPAGIFRDGDYTAKFQKDFFLDFDDEANFNVPRTPGTTNTFVQDDIGFDGPGDGTLAVFGQKLFTGSSATLLIENTPADAPIALLVARKISLTPFAGGRLLPFPPDVFLGLTADSNGQFSATLPGGFGKSYFFQAVYIDLAQPQSFGITNTVRVDFKN